MNITYKGYKTSLIKGRTYFFMLAEDGLEYPICITSRTWFADHKHALVKTA